MKLDRTRLLTKASRAMLVLALAAQTAACSSENGKDSDVLVTSVDHTVVKRQSIGNCWLYAQATWLESLALSHTGEKIDVSESYWTYWHWYSQLVNSSATEIETGGFWSESNRLILEHGWVLEKDFIPSEDGVEMSRRQDLALRAMNEQLKAGGRLANRADGTEVSITDTLRGGMQDRWQSATFPQVYGKDTVVSNGQEAARKQVLVRVMKALNDRKPVVMTLMIDFNALDNATQTFKYSKLADSGPGRQGGHMVVLHDYAVKDVPGIGEIPEGDVADDLKVKALEGAITMLKAKNSWGSNRPDRGLTDGYTRFDSEYLTKQLEWKREGSDSSFYTTLSNFVLPPGY